MLIICRQPLSVLSLSAYVFFSSLTQAENATSAPCADSAIPQLTSEGSYNFDLSGFEANGVNQGGTAGALNSCAVEIIDFSIFDEMTGSGNVVIDDADSFLFEGIVAPGNNLYTHSLRSAPGLDSQGVYALYDPNHNQRYVLIQASGDFFTPGAAIFRIKNNAASPIPSFRFNFRWYYNNDSPHASRFRVFYNGNPPEATGIEISDISEAPMQPVEGVNLRSNCESIVINDVGFLPGVLSHIELFFGERNGAVNTGPSLHDEIGFGSIRVTTDMSDKNCQSFPSGLVIPLLVRTGSPSFNLTDIEYIRYQEQLYRKMIDRYKASDCAAENSNE